MKPSSKHSFIAERQSKFPSKFQTFEHEVNSLDDGGQLIQSSRRFRDDISVSSKGSSRFLESNKSLPKRTKKSTQAAQDNNIEVKALLQPPPKPPRTKPFLFLSKNSNPEPLLSKVLKTTQMNSSSRPHDFEMTLASVRRGAHAFLNPTNHCQNEPRSQHRRFRTTILKLKLYFNHRQYLRGQNLSSFCQQTAIHNHCYENF